MKVVMVKPGMEAVAAEVENTLEALQEVVGGLIECVYPFEDAVGIVCNEEGKILNLPMNRALYGEGDKITDVLCGDFVVCGLGEEDFVDLSDEMMEKYLKMFRAPETFTVKEMGGRRVIQVEKNEF